MDIQQMKARCPDAVPIGLGVLPGFEFIINSRGVATIINNPLQNVHGVLWSISAADELSLDSYEGVDDAVYCKSDLDLQMTDGSVCSALCYIATNHEKGQPRKGYMEQIINAAEDQNFFREYIEGVLMRWKIGV